MKTGNSQGKDPTTCERNSKGREKNRFGKRTKGSGAFHHFKESACDLSREGTKSRVRYGSESAQSAAEIRVCFWMGVVQR